MTRLMKVREVAEYARVSYQSVLDWIHTGHLPSVRLPSRREDGGGQRRVYLVDQEDIDRLIDESRTVPKLVPVSAGSKVKKRAIPEKGWHLKYRGSVG